MRSAQAACPTGVQRRCRDHMHGQNGEDAAIFAHFFQERRGDGVYVEVGAYDGRTYSNSLFFEVALGWSGVLVEAHAVTIPACTSRICVCNR